MRGWRDGTYLAAVLTARIYGNPPVGRYLGAHQTLSKFASRALLAWECSFPLVIVLPAPVSYTVLAIGAAFHVTNAVLMGLNCFVWSFFAVYPPLLWVVSPAADGVNGYRFDANLWDPALPPAEAARRAGRPAGFEMHPPPA